MSEPLLLKLELCATTSLTEAFMASLARSTAEERAFRACERLATKELGEEALEKLADLLRGVVIYAGMHTQRQLDALQLPQKATT